MGRSGRHAQELEGRCVDFRIVKPEDPTAALMDVSLG